MVETPGKITLWQIEIFAAAAEEASITAAARRLGASPSAVSQQLTNLEAALGVKLMERGERPMPLTRAGELFLARSESILREAALATTELARGDVAARMRLRLGMIEDFDADVSPALLTTLAEKMPSAQFLMETGASHRLIDKLESRALDLVIATDPSELPAGLEAHPLMDDPYVLVTPRRMVRGDDKMLDVLRKTPLLQYTGRHFMGRQIANHLRRQNLMLSHRFELDSYHAIMAMVAKREGWSILTPLGVLRAKRFVDRVDIYPLPFTPLSRRISLLARRGDAEEMASDVAAVLKPLLRSEIIDYCCQRMPWLDGQMRLL